MVSISTFVGRSAAKPANKRLRQRTGGRGVALYLAFVFFFTETVSSSNTRTQYNYCQVTDANRMVRDDNADCAEVAGTTDHTSVELLAEESWLGTEKNLLPVLEERKGVYDILSGLSDVDRLAMEATDKTMPIRHLRAEKVRHENPVLLILIAPRTMKQSWTSTFDFEPHFSPAIRATRKKQSVK